MRLLSVITAATAVGASFVVASPVQAVDFPFRTLGFDYEQQFPCTLIVLSNQPSENQDDLGLWLTKDSSYEFCFIPFLLLHGFFIACKLIHIS